MKCHNCHMGTVSPVAGPGRTTRYKSLPNLAVPADLAIMTCNHCAEEWMAPADAKRIDEVLDVVYRQELRRRALEVLPGPHEAARIERDLGLSHGYISRIRKGKVPSADLVALLALIYKRPGLLREIEAFWEGKAVKRVQPKSKRRSGDDEAVVEGAA